jgi:hypothetical protein
MQATLIHSSQPTTAQAYDAQLLRELVEMEARIIPGSRAQWEKAAMILVLRSVLPQDDGSTLVESVEHPGSFYRVHGMCSCPDAQKRGRVCKHALAVMLRDVHNAVLAKRAGASGPRPVCPVCSAVVDRLVGGECARCLSASLSVA